MVATAVIASGPGVGPASALGGDLWTGFSGDGLAPTGVPSSGRGFAVAVDPATGRIYEAAYASSGEFSGQAYVAAFTSGGILDSTFSGDGLAATGIRGTFQAAIGLAVDPATGRVYVATYGSDTDPAGQLQVAALRGDGTLDPGFSGDGLAQTGILGRTDGGTAVVVDPVTGRVLVAGQALFFTGNGDMSGQAYLAAFRFDGSLDPAFSGDGLAPTGITGNSDAGNGLAADPSTGRVYMSGWAEGGTLSHQPFLAAFGPDGVLDSTFSGDGIASGSGSLGGASAGYSVAVDHRTGRVYLGAPVGWVTAFDREGNRDGAFGKVGFVGFTLFGQDNTLRTGIAVDPRSGAVYVPLRAAGFQAAVVAYDQHGVLHRGFGPANAGSGFSPTGVRGGTGVSYGMAVAPTTGTVYLATRADGGSFGGEAYVAAFERANPMPIATADSASVAFPATVTIDVLANDYDPEGEPVSVLSVLATDTAGAVSVNPDGTITYDSSGVTVGRGASVVDTFRYYVTDGRSRAIATVSVTVNGPPNAVPVAAADAAAVTFPASTTIAVAANDSDPEGDPLTVVGVDTTGTAGTVTLNADGTVGYDSSTVALAPGTTVQDTFRYFISDGFDTVAATVTVTVERDQLGTGLTVYPAIVDRFIPRVYLAFSATLTDETGQPVVGRRVTYRVGSSEICGADTDANGLSSCSSPQGLASAIVSNGYRAEFAGDISYKSSTGSAPAIRR